MARINATIPQWNGEMWIYRPSIDGVQKKYTSRKPGPAGARECVKKYNAAVGAQDTSRVRLEQAWEEYLVDKKKRLGEHADSYIKAVSMGKTHLVPPMKLKKVGKITSQDWQDVLNDARPTRGGHKVMAKKTLMSLRAEIMAFGKFCKKAKYIDEKWEDLTIPKTAPTIGKAIMQLDALQALLRAEDGDWYLNVWKLMATTGMRPGEVYGLQRADVENGLICVRRSINNHKRVTGGKNENAVRTMVQKPIDAKILSDQLEMLKKHGIISPWLFCDEYGGQPNPLIITHHWAAFRKRFPVHVTQYGLRHTFVSHSKTVLPDALMKQLVGHSASMDTIGTYGKMVTGDDKQAAKIVGDMFQAIVGEY